LKRGRRILVDIPDEVLQSESCSGKNQLRIMNQDYVVILRLRPHDRPGRLPRPEAASAGGAGNIHTAQTAATGTLLASRWNVQTEGAERRGVGYVPPRGNQGVELALPDPGVFRVVHDGDHEGKVNA
jgi:hypothetical protein